MRFQHNLPPRTWAICAQLPDHAPTNAVYCQDTGWYSTLGGRVFGWADAQGRSLGTSNRVPSNFYGERTKPGTFREPREQILSEVEMLMMHFRQKVARMYPKGYIEEGTTQRWMPLLGKADKYTESLWINEEDERNRQIAQDPELAQIHELLDAILTSPGGWKAFRQQYSW